MKLNSWRSALAFLFVLMLTTPYAPAVMAALPSVAPQPIQVYVGENKLKFAVYPVAHADTVYVEFRGLFQALGYAVAYDQSDHIITAAAEGLLIRMELRTGHTFVNGRQANAPAPLVVNSRAMVPIRFVSEATGFEVNWDSRSQAVRLLEPQLTQRQSEAIGELLMQYEADSNGHRIEAMLAAFTEDSPILTTADPDAMREEADARSTVHFERVHVELSGPKEAEVTMKAVYSRAAGASGFFLKREEAMALAIRQMPDETWKIYDLAVTSVSYPDAASWPKQAVDVPEAERTAIMDVIGASAQAMNEENVDALAGAYELTEVEDAAFRYFYEAVFAQADYTFTVEQASVIAYEDGLAHVYVVQEERSYALRFRSQYVYQLRKTEDGKWLIDDDVAAIGSEELPVR
ncbi:ketosteroid isomerase-like protein [Paenibacillus phyllosphaerae]|uniref:Ketosteroid isomerase-like protein n=1 Tax=Paenibacillus phyllosphaerae TaxID=274593 RepID=A0A7W5B1H0_9BACL|nr:copper amine oxidase N-terminal domain-containing protein [Paenibacillus phyllosphaerae]MBB3112668.1 ketosteroid isomerase-like protein [Paenibacillus phyllosphaerae]